MANFRQIGGKRFKKGRGNEFKNRGESRPNFSGKNREDFGGGERGPAAMHRATCAQCGKPCEVPFRPVGGKPVYCRDCFQDKKPEIGRERGRFPRKSFNDRNFARPGFGSDSGNGNQNEMRDQIRALGAKIDRLAEAVEALAGNGPRLPEKD